MEEGLGLALLPYILINHSIYLKVSSKHIYVINVNNVNNKIYARDDNG